MSRAEPFWVANRIMDEEKYDFLAVQELHIVA
jgi:hypothetical protein